MRRLVSGHVLILALSTSALIAACGNSTDSKFGDGSKNDEDGGAGGPGDLVGGDNPGGNDGDGGAVQPLIIDPPTLTVTVGGTLAAPTGGGAFTAHVGSDPTPVAVKWSVDDIRYGAIDGTGNFAAKPVGGKTKVRARLGAQEALADVEVKLAISEDFASLTDDVKNALRAGGTADAGFKWLYPYDHTVFPRGLNAPTLQFAGTAPTAYRVHVKSSRMDVEGFYPGGTGAARVTVKEEWWKAVTLGTDATEAVQIEVTKISGGNVTGPQTVNWHIAPGSLRGSIYYNSYNSTLAGGGAVLSLKPGKPLDVLLSSVDVPIADPPTAAGKKGCIVCHSVSATGNRLVSGIYWNDQAPDYSNPSYSGSFTINAGVATLNKVDVDGRKYAFGALSPDGNWMVSNGVAGGIRGLSNTSYSRLIDVATGNVVTEPFFSGATNRNAVTPTFSPDGKLIAFNDGGGQKLSIASFTANTSPPTIANEQLVYTTTAARVGWPTFTPDGGAILAHVGEGFDTENRKADLVWIDIATKKATSLDSLNGKSAGSYYLPYGETEDGHKNYEPTLLPVPVGGYYWVVFTSRRSLGNTIYKGQYSVNPNGGNGDDAYQTGDGPKKGVRKKLWVSAIDVNRPADADISHPAFYLEGQELEAGNMRGFWALDQCKADGSTCEGGDECCNGFCRNVEQSDGSVVAQCVPPPTGCANETERCTADADCCGVSGGTKCLNGACTTPAPTTPK